MTDGIQFGTLTLGADGKGHVTNARIIKHSDIAACPHVIFVPEHYREDGSCRCDEGHYDDDGNWVPTKPKPAVKTWLARIHSGVFTKGQCTQFTLVVTRQVRGLQAQGNRTSLTVEDADLLYGRLQQRGGVRLEEEHTKQGIEWLRRYGKKVLDLPEGILDSFDHFSFHGDAVTYGNYGNGTLPVWRIHLTDGRAFDYYNAAWQTGLSSADRGAWVWVGGGEEL